MFDGKPLSVALPASIELTVTDTAPQAKGATASNQNKEAFVETGARIRVPPFIENGQVGQGESRDRRVPRQGVSRF